MLPLTKGIWVSPGWHSGKGVLSPCRPWILVKCENDASPVTLLGSSRGATAALAPEALHLFLLFVLLKKKAH